MILILISLVIIKNKKQYNKNVFISTILIIYILHNLLKTIIKNDSNVLNDITVSYHSCDLLVN